MVGVLFAVVWIVGWFFTAFVAEKVTWFNKECGGIWFIKMMLLNIGYNVTLMVLLGIGCSIWGSHVAGVH